MKLKKVDYKRTYEQMTGGLAALPAVERSLTWMDRILTILMIVSYAVVLVTVFGASWRASGMAAYGWYRVLPFILIPGSGFAAVSVIRLLVNRPRPYRTWAIHPLLHKEADGCSMPSRHVFSAAMIAMCVWRISAPAGAVYLAIAAVAAMLRVTGGVHYISDVVIGLLLGIGLGSLLFLF
ncbi:MAG: phosphatase PAP2 family protein [Eubacteriales bacterium]|nr:phosphatase PAP2 family protein [Eubacteriales bacterium]